MSEQEEFWAVVDQEDSHHYGTGLLAIVKTEKEATALKVAMDRKWDGCEGTYKIRVFKIKVGLERFYKQRFCKHDWTDRGEVIYPFVHEGKPWAMGVFVCQKCGDRFHKQYLKEGKKLPLFDGIAYYDEELKRLVFKDE